MSKAASAVARKGSVVVTTEPNLAAKKVGAASGPLDKRLQVKSNAEDDDWSKWNIQELRTSMVEDRANLQATLREANRLLSEQGAPPLVDIGGIVSDTAASAAAIAKRSNAAEAAVADVPQPVHAGAKKLAAAAPAASVTSKAPPPAPAAAGKAVPRADMRAKTPSTTFLTGGEFDGDDDELAKEFTIGHDLDARLVALQELLGMDRSRALREAINSDKRNDHVKLTKLAAMYRELKGASSAADASRSGEIDALHAKISELQAESQFSYERIKVAENIEKEHSDKQRQHHTEIKALKNEIESHNSRLRMSEADLAKITDKLKKREIEVVRLRETMEKMSQQLTKNVEDKDAALLAVVDAQQRAKSHLERLETTQEELRKREAEVRVLKRNQSLSLPEELKKLGEKLRLMDLERRRAIVDKEEKDVVIAEIKKELSAKEEEIVSVKIDKSAWMRKATEAESELQSIRHTSDGERKLMQMEKSRLSDKNNYFRSKLQGEEEHRMRTHFDGRAQENDLISMRKRNMELLSQLHLTDEARLRAENTAREATQRCNELKDKLMLQHTVQRLDLTKQHLARSMEQGCEDDIADTFHLPRTGPRARTSMAGSGKLQHQHQQQQQQQQDQQSAGESVYAMSDAAQQKEIDRLATKLRQMESKLLSEEKARAAAQERIVDMAEQLLEKDRLREILAAEVAQRSSKRKESKSKIRELTVQSQTLGNRLNESTIENEQMQFKLKEREEEIRLLRKTKQDLQFRVQMEEEGRQRAQDALELTRRQEEDDAMRRAHAASGGSPNSKPKVAAEGH